MMQSIFDYSDYRQFIKDYCETHKAMNSAFSLRYFAQKAGVNSSAFFKFLIEGKRNLTHNSILKVCLALKLIDREAEYFENLVFFNQAKSIQEKNQYFEKLVGQQKARNVAIVKESHYDFYSEWYHCIIRELVTMHDFKNDFAKLGKMLNPAITAKQAKESVDLLLKLEFLKIADGKYQQTEPIIHSGYGVRAHEIIRYQIKMLQMAIGAFDRCSNQERLNTSYTFGLSQDNFLSFVRKIRAFNSQLLETARTEDKPEIVYQYNINLFPLTKTVGPEAKHE